MTFVVEIEYYSRLISNVRALLLIINKIYGVILEAHILKAAFKAKWSHLNRVTHVYVCASVR